MSAFGTGKLLDLASDMDRRPDGEPDILESPGLRPADSALSAAKETVEARRGRGRPRKYPLDGAGAGESANKTKYTQNKEALAKELDALFTPDQWAPICRAPADLMLAATGRKCWDMPESEAKTLGASAAMTARYFMRTDPKWIALALLGFGVMQVYGSKIAAHAAEVRKEKKS